MARYRGFDGFRRFPPSVPLDAEGGIRAHSRRGAFASSWWGRRWIEVLEGFGLGARLRRGKRYARKGQVLTLEVQPGAVRASVQGSRERPYRVEIHLPPIPPGRWKDVLDRLTADIRIGARLLAGEMPPEIEDVAVDADVRLFPERLHDLETSCSCPDWSNPCKHIAAVHYLLAEELDRDPFLLFRLRGMDREAFTAALAEAGGVLDAEVVEGEGRKTPDAAAGDLWPADPATFWGGIRGEERGPPARDDSVPPSDPLPPVPATHAALVRRLGTFPFWRGERPFLDEMTDLYRAASRQARELLGEEPE